MDELLFFVAAGFLMLLIARLTQAKQRPPLVVDPQADFGSVSAAYAAFLLSDARVPCETRRLAAGLAPHARRTTRHYGNCPGALRPPPPSDAPYNALRALRAARDARAWDSPEAAAEARAAVNYSLYTWNTLFPPSLK
jgi:hypothetical protein